MSEEKKSLVEVIDQARDRFVSVTQNGINYDAEKEFAIGILTNNDYLMAAAKSHPPSLLQAITNVAAIQLSLNPAEKLAYLIPRNVKVADGKWQTRVFLEPSYMGLCKLATDSGAVEWIQARPVYANDEFIDNGMGEKPTHKYKAFSDRGEFVGVFCQAKLKTGDHLVEIMSAAEVNAIRDRSESWKKNQSGPWKTDYVEQARKTVVRRAYKMWPKSDGMERLAAAVEISNQNEGFESMVSSPKLTQFNAEQKGYFDQFIEKGDALGMYVFKHSLCGYDATSDGANIWANLMHSFPKGEKGKFQKVVNELCASGESQFTAIVDAIAQANTERDSYAALEILQDITQECIRCLKERTGAEISAFIDDCLSQGKAA